MSVLPTKEEIRIAEKAYADKENLTQEEYRIIEHLADQLNLEHDLSLKKAAKRILEYSQ